MPTPIAVFVKNLTLVAILPPEIQHGAATIKHKYHRREEKQAHKDIENAVSLATRVFDVFHIVLRNFVVRKMWRKSRKAQITF